MVDLIKHFLKRLIDWRFRRRSPAIFVMGTGLTCLTVSLAVSFTFDIALPLHDGILSFSFNTGEGTPGLLIYSVAILGGVLIVVGLAWEIVRYFSEQRRLSRRKVIVIEARGLRDGVGIALADALPEDIEGNRDPVIIDLRQGIIDGHIVSPQTAVDRLVSLPVDLSRREAGLNRSDIQRVYGGLAPVPLTFLTGILIDDESSVLIFDWDRHQKKWRALDDLDDKKRFNIDGTNAIVQGTTEVAVLVSVSYQVDELGVHNKLPDMPYIHLSLEDSSPDSHWSEEKQRAIGRQFLETIIGISNHGVSRIHLFIAAPNSVVFRFGSLYDKRNLPDVVVYQYQREENPPYPWGILMPVGGRLRPEVMLSSD